MPLYEYECGSCGHRFEVIQKFSDSPIEQCPLCNQPVRKLVSRSAFQLKGTGWYVTDYASKRNSEGGLSHGRKADAPSDSTDSGSKPAASPAASDSGTASPASSSGDSHTGSSTGGSQSTKPDAKPSKSE